MAETSRFSFLSFVGRPVVPPAIGEDSTMAAGVWSACASSRGSAEPFWPPRSLPPGATPSTPGAVLAHLPRPPPACHPSPSQHLDRPRRGGCPPAPSPAPRRARFATPPPSLLLDGPTGYGAGRATTTVQSWTVSGAGRVSRAWSGWRQRSAPRSPRRTRAAAPCGSGRRCCRRPIRRSRSDRLRARPTRTCRTQLRRPQEGPTPMCHDSVERKGELLGVAPIFAG